MRTWVYAEGGRYMKVVPVSTIVDRKSCRLTGRLWPSMRISSTVMSYAPVLAKGIHVSARCLSGSGTLPPSTIAPTSSLRQIEKTLGACSDRTSHEKRVPPNPPDCEKPVMPSATWLRKSPDS